MTSESACKQPTHTLITTTRTHNRNHMELFLPSFRPLTNPCILPVHQHTHTPPPPQYYPYINNVTVDTKGLLAQDLQDFGLEKFKWLYGVAQDAGLRLRISETNSL